MTAKRLTRTPRTEQDQERRQLLLAAASGALGYSAPVSSPMPPPGTGPCSDCGTPIAPHRGELRTTRVAPGVVRDERVCRCTDCHRRHQAELAAAIR